MNFALRQAQVSQSSGIRFLALELFRMHEKHETRLRGDRRDRRTPAQRLGPKTAVTRLATHASVLGTVLTGRNAA